MDASNAVHQDCKGQTGGLMTIGKGDIYSTSVKQKINTKSSTEIEIVAVDDVMPQIMWTKYFLEAQGYTNNDIILHQDNMSAMLLEANGSMSSTKRTKHINVRYYFIKDRIDSKYLKLRWCSTDMMLADFFTKPLLGPKFWEFRKLIMNSNY